VTGAATTVLRVSYVVRPVVATDLDDVLVVNNASVPAVSELDAPALAELVRQSRLALAVVDDDSDEVAGFALCLLPGAAYASENYRWFERRSADFLYVDRIAVGEGARGRGLGRTLYAAIFDDARALGVAEVCCEVNTRPPNPGSMRFHTRLGFVEVGRQSTKGGTVDVAMLAAPALVG
jgi:predicted GNAT superfamily acetyltransferase